MYIPKLNAITDRHEALAFMKRFSFGTIVTSKSDLPVATHLPFLVELRDDVIVLVSHFARANKQWKDIEQGNVLVIFSEPHAYISPTNYEKELNVPTWNYIAVHAYGSGNIITETDRVRGVLERTIDNYEATYRKQWNKLPEDYKLKMSKGIVAFEIVVSDLQAKKKLSQNKTEAEKTKIINSLSDSHNTADQLIAEYMINESR